MSFAYAQSVQRDDLGWRPRNDALDLLSSCLLDEANNVVS